jgi:hypothetical protein
VDVVERSPLLDRRRLAALFCDAFVARVLVAGIPSDNELSSEGTDEDETEDLRGENVSLRFWCALRREQRRGKEPE